ncbi:hypothetical protein EI42_05895 [Thermosporothrix hazakensis]|jgi:DNA-binding MarR family transcriptional regulator|uniref:Uncharacterized protein n=1 Tax=Thermosporothrix hazakensis TaxID=644383 RepID=A0A326TWW3_THEHA|nr:helix-turn-helix domain-containing protein [Thermosporothrix hazakensis]PZW20749.1 hypothetical protein EI42_05895 [Thermosporothrix hazakensis]GCE49876.1 hypothetical protein KTH_47450 [Thermosporothrix hazakensis]
MQRERLFRFPYGMFLMVRLEYVLLTRDELEAQILRVLEGELEMQRQRWQQEAAAARQMGRVVPAEPSGWVRLSQAQLLSRLYKFDTAKVGGARQPLSMSKTTLRRALKRLTGRGYVQVRQEPGDPLGRACYQLQVEAIQQALDALPHMADPHRFFWQEGMSESADGFSVHDGGTSVQESETPFQNGETSFQNGGTPFQNGETSFQNGGTPLPHWRPYKKEKREEEREKQEPKEAASSVIMQSNVLAEREGAAAVSPLDEALGVQGRSGKTSTWVERTPLSAAPGVEGDQGKQPPLSPRVTSSVVAAAEVQQETIQVPGMAGEAVPALSASTVQPAEAEAREGSGRSHGARDVQVLEAEAVVALIERLRGKGYSREQREHELRAAARLLTLEPKVSLQEIEAAWTHGSDAYWRRTHQGEQVHVHDLVHRDSHGRYRVHAFLEHLKQQKLRLRVPVERSCPSQVQEQIPYAVMVRQRAAAVAKVQEQPPCVSQPGKQPSMHGEMRGEEPPHSSGLTQRQAQQLATILAQQAASLGLHLESAAQPTESGWQVCLRWKTPAGEAGQVLVSKAVEGLRFIKGMSARECETQQRRSA